MNIKIFGHVLKTLGGKLATQTQASNRIKTLEANRKIRVVVECVAV